MPSLLVLSDGNTVEARKLPGRLRGLAWDRKGSYITLVGNGGRMLKIQDNGEIIRDDSYTAHNLRSVSVNPVDGDALVVGNAGTVIEMKANGTFAELNPSTYENLRVVRWNSDGDTALMAGNNGSLIKYMKHGLESISGGRANLRGISWRRNALEALITSNCFAEEFIPSPNLFLFDARKNVLKPVSESRSDLIGVDWNPAGTSALVVGYDVVWHNGFIGRFDGLGLSPIEFQSTQTYPTAVSWDPNGRVAAIATSIAQLHSGQGRIILWNGETFHEIYRNRYFSFSNMAWSPVGFKLAAIGSSETRTFDS